MEYFKSAEQYFSEMTSGEKEVDTSEHSLIYKANMPVSMELSYNSMLLDEVKKRIYAKSALESQYYDDLVKRCADMGIDRTLGSYASGIVTVKGIFAARLYKGSFVSTKDNRLYTTTHDVVLDEKGEGKVNIKATEPGSDYNVKVGEICSFPVSYKGINSVKNDEEIQNGSGEETYEHLYNRYKTRITEVVTSGNANYYKLKAMEVDGVGIANVKECTDENKVQKEGHVLVIISNSNNRKADTSLISKTQEYLEKNRFVGAKIHVISVEEVVINISLKVDSENDINEVQKNIKNGLEKYFNSLTGDYKYISMSKINAEILKSDSSINDIKGLTLNNTNSSVNISNGSIAVLGTVNVSKVV